MKKLLSVGDYQNDFIDGSLGFPSAEKLDSLIANKIEAYRAVGGDILFTLDTHEQNCLNTQEGRNWPVPHCIRGTDGHKLYGKIAEMQRPEDKVIEKPNFASKELMNYLHGKEYETIEVTGLVSNICVISNVVAAKGDLPDVPIILDAMYIGSDDAKLHEEVLDIIENPQVKVLNR